MLSRFFHAWEHRLASATKDRVVRPFEWGLDWLPSDPHPNGFSPEARIEHWVREAMADSEAFFRPPPTTAYAFEEASATLRETGEAGTLRFPSALTTPHEANNIVHARWFPAPGEAPLGRSGARGRAVVVLPQWNSDAGGHVGLSRLLARFGVSALRLSLPYHDARMPPELTRADYIVSSNVVRTVQVCRQAVMDARRAVAWLSQQGFERIGILGTSLGSCLAMLTAAHEPLIKAQALNHVSPWFADVVWRGLSTRHVRDGLDGHIGLDTLRHLWQPISPWAHLERVARQSPGTRTLLVYARYDLTFPVDLSRTLIDEYRRLGIAHEVAVLPCGHYSTGFAPFKFVDGYILTTFLRNNL
jgi:pimeloyl-ACP methyl ester carboxylesterase